jgi:hypothetical protein
MGDVYEQFLGADPGIVVELVDGSSSPFILRAEDGFEFHVSAEDFYNYYRKKGAPAPEKWLDFVTEPETGLVNSGKMAQVMATAHSFEKAFGNFSRARSFVRAAAEIMEADSGLDPAGLKSELEKREWKTDGVSNKDFEKLIKTPPAIRKLLISQSCAMGAFPEQAMVRPPNVAPEPTSGAPATKSGVKKSVKGFRGRMKNIEMTTEGDLLTMKIDLSKEFGPSKSGKTIIIASTEGNISIPGREEKVGMNVYKSPEQKDKGATGQKSSFKNVEMNVTDMELTIAVDLSKEFGPSKSGKTIIIASTEGNQLVVGREDKIGLNVYRKAE